MKELSLVCLITLSFPLTKPHKLSANLVRLLKILIRKKNGLKAVIEISGRSN